MMQLSRTPLHEAACVGSVEVVTKLLDRGADVGEKDVVRKSFVIGLFIYIYIYVCVCVCVCVYIYNIYIYSCLQTF